MSRGIGSLQRHILARLEQGGGGMSLDAKYRRLEPLGRAKADGGWVPLFELIPRDAPPPADMSKPASVPASTTVAYWIEEKYMPTRSELHSVQRAVRNLAERGLVEVWSERHLPDILVRLALSDEELAAEREQGLRDMQAWAARLAGIISR